jgi:hypothetical protein
MFDLTKLSDWLKLPTKAFVGLALASAILVFASQQFLVRLGLYNFVMLYRHYIGLIFIFSTSFTCIYFGSTIMTFIKPWIIQWYQIRLNTKRLHSLTPTEKKILAVYITRQTRSQPLDIRDGVVNSLVSAGIIYRASSVGVFTDFAFAIQPWAWTYLNKHPNLLD